MGSKNPRGLLRGSSMFGYKDVLKLQGQFQPYQVLSVETVCLNVV